MNRGTALRQMTVVLRKELKDALRDRRSLISMVFMILLGPGIMAAMMNGMAGRQRDAENISIPVVGGENASALVEWLRQQEGVQVVDGPEDPEAAVRDQKQDVVLVIPPEFGERFRASRPAPVKLVGDTSRNSTRPKLERVRRLLQRYSSEIGTLRLVSRGISPSVVSTLQVQDVEVSSAQQRAAMILGIIPMFAVMAAFSGGMQLATDSTAGERERGSFEPLLTNPAPRLAIASGKWLAAALLAMVTVVVNVVLTLTMFHFIPLQDIGVRFRIGPVHAVTMLAALLPLCLFTTALQICIATLARSFKEAQGTLSLVMLLPMLPGVLAMMYPTLTQPWMYPVPVLGQYTLLTSILGGRMPPASHFLVATLMMLTLAGVGVMLTTRLFRSERVIFGR